jgi:hypothetical protein
MVFISGSTLSVVIENLELLGAMYPISSKNFLYSS